MRLLRKFPAACALLLPVVLLAAAMPDRAHAAKAKSFLLAPADIQGLSDDQRWMGPAMVESLRIVLQRLYQRFGDLPSPALEPPRDLAGLTPERVRAWLGKSFPEETDVAVFCRARAEGESFVLLIYPVDIRQGKPARELKSVATAKTLPAAIKVLAEQFMEYQEVGADAEARKTAIKDLSDVPDALRLFALSYLAKTPEDRLKRLEEAVKADAGFVAGWMQLGLAYFMNKQLPPSRTAFARVTTLNPRFREAFNNLGVVSGEMGDETASEKAFREAIRLDESYVDALYNLGKLLDRQKKYKEALEGYEKAVKLAPERTDIRFHYALTLDRLTKNDQALEQFRIISPKDPSLAEGFFLEKAKESRQERAYESAEAYLRRALEIKPDYNVAYRELGTTAFMSGDYAKSIDYFKTLVSRDPQSAEAHHYLGLALNKIDRVDEALVEFRRAVEIGDLKESYLELGRMLIGRERYTEAVNALNRYLKQVPDSEEGKDLLSQATRRGSEEAERMQKKADFAVLRLDKMDQIVSDLNRRNAELETRLTATSAENVRLTKEAERLRTEKSATEAEFARAVQEASRSLKDLNGELSGLRSAQAARLSALEAAVEKEKKGREAAEKDLVGLNDRLKKEGVTDAQRAALAEAQKKAEAILKQNESLEAEKSALQQQLARAAQDKGAITQSVYQDLEALRAKLATTERTLKSAQEEKADLVQARSRKEQELADLRQSSEQRYQSLLDARKGLLEELATFRETNQARVNELETILGREKAVRQEAENRSAALAASERALRVKLDESVGLQSGAEGEKAALARDLAAAQTARKDLESQLARKQDELGAAAQVAQQAAVQKQAELSALQATLKRAEADRDAQARENATLQAARKDLESQLARKREELDATAQTAQGKLADRDRELAAARTDSQSLARELTVAKADVESLRAALAVRDRDQAALNDKVKVLEQAAAEQKRRIEQLAKERETLTAAGADLQKRTKDLTMELEARRAELRVAQEGEKSSRQLLGERERELAGLRAANQEQEAGLKAVWGRLESAGAERETLSRETAQLQKVRKDQEGLLAARQADVVALEKKLAERGAELEMARGQLREAEKSLQESRRSVEALGTERDLLSRERAALQKNVQGLEETVRGRLAELTGIRETVNALEGRLREGDARIKVLEKDSLDLRRAASGYLSSLGEFYMARGNGGKAQEVYRMAIAWHPEYGPAYLGLGDVYLQMGDYKESEEMYRKASQLMKSGEKK